MTTTPIRCVVLGLVVALLAPPRPCDAAEGPAVLVLQAAAENDDAALKRIAERRDVDPWKTAYAVAQKDLAAAKRFARASDYPGMAALRKYLDGRRATTPDTVAAALAWARRAPASAADRAARRAAIDAARADADAFERCRLDLLAARADPWPTSRKAYDRAKALAESLGWLSGLAELYFRSGLAALHAGDAPETGARWREQLAIEARRGARGAKHRVLENLAGLAGHQGDFKGAIAALEDLAASLKAAGNAAALSDTLLNLSYFHHLRGELRSSLRFALQAADLLNRAKQARAWAEVQVRIGDAYQALGDLAEALECHERAVEVYEAEQRPGSMRDLGLALGSLGRTRLRLEERTEALADLDAARAHLEGAQAEEALVVVLGQMAIAHRGLANHDKAISYARKALAIASKRNDAWAITDIEQNLARCYTRAGRLDDAMALLDKSLVRAEELGVQTLIGDGYFYRAEVLLLRGDAVGALAACDEAHAAILEMVVGLPEGTNAHARAVHAQVFDLALRAAAQAGSPSAYFTWVEHSRSGALLESMGDRAALLAAHVPEELRVAESKARDREAKAENDYREARADATATRKQRRVLRRAIDAARADLREIRTRIQLARRAASDLFYPKSDTLAAAQKRLLPTQALIAYTLSDQRARALVVTSKQARIVDLGPAAPVEEAAEATLEGAKHDDGEIEKPLAKLRSLLIDPLRLDASVTSWIVMPDGALYSVPFAALDTTRTVTHAPSATTLGVLQGFEAVRGEDILALGAPVYRGRGLAALPGTRAEVQAIGTGHRVLLGEEAGEASLRTELSKRPRWRALHLACHGLIDTDHPLQCSLELSVQPRTDGRLMAAEVFDMELACDLAVLSACQTGRGTVVKSEGLLGLTRAFMVAGAPRVICSLWKVDDQATRALMVEFYRLWNPPRKPGDNAPSISAAEALRRAQEHVRTTTRDGKQPWAHPYYWAAWTLWGVPS